MTNGLLARCLFPMRSPGLYAAISLVCSDIWGCYTLLIQPPATTLRKKKKEKHLKAGFKPILVRKPLMSKGGVF